MEKKQIILPKLKYENAPEAENQIRIGFDEEKSLLRNDDRDIILNLSEQFATERATSNKYKLYGKMKMIFKNLYLGTTPYPFLRERLYLQTDGSDNCFAGYLPYDEFAFLRTEIHKETTAEAQVSVMSGFTGFDIIQSGSTLTDHRDITAITAPYHNWNLYLTYVSDHSTTFPMKYTLTGATKVEGYNRLTFTSGDGIPFRVELSDNAYVFTSPVKHGIKQGEYLIVNSKSYYVNSVGSQYYNSENYVLTISASQVPSTGIPPLVTGKRCTDINDLSGTTSQYYTHIHTVLNNPTDCGIDKVGFESPIWEDEKKLLYENSMGVNDVTVVRNRMESVLFDFKNPFILTGITNNLNYTPTEIYSTIIFRNGNGYFKYPPKVGYSFHFHDTWIDDHFSGVASSEIGITGTTFVRSGDSGAITFTPGITSPLTIGSTLKGAFVEYNPREMRERIISEAFHKIVVNPSIFNHLQTSSGTYSGATVTNPIGLYYQPHYRFKLRELSPYTETSFTANIENLPENARYFSAENLWRWRDLYDDGYVDPDGYGTDYPYMNDIHYIHQDINFYLRNELVYTNKKDGVLDFFVRKNNDDCFAGTSKSPQS